MDEGDLWRRIAKRAGRDDDHAAKTVKAALARQLAAEIGCETLDALADVLASENEDLLWTGGANRAADIGVDDDRRATTLVVLAGAWESSGATRRAPGIALHLAAARRFGLTEIRLLHRADPEVVKRAEVLLAEYGRVIDAFIESQYRRTREILGGLEAIVAARGYICRKAPRVEQLMSEPPLLPLASFSLDPHTATCFPVYPELEA